MPSLLTPVPRRSALARYGFAGASILIAVAVRVALAPVFGDKFPFLFCFLAVLGSAWYGGFGPAVVAAGLGGALTSFLVLATPLAVGSVQLLHDLVYLVVSAGVILFGRAMQRAYERAAAAVELAEAERRRAEFLLAGIQASDVALRRSETRYRKLVEQAPLSVQIFAPDGTTRQVNRAWQERWGRSLDDLAGENVLQEPQLERLGIMPAVRRAFAGEAVAIGPVSYVPDRGRFQGREIWVRAVMYPVKDEHDRIEEVVLIYEDISEQRRAERALRESEERLRLALDAGQVGVWDWDILANRVTWSERIYQFHGLAPGTFGGRVEDFAALVHPDDAARVTEALRRALEEHAEYEVEFRTIVPDGSISWQMTNGRVIFDDAGRPMRMLGATIDTTVRKSAEEALREADRRKDEFFAMLGHELRNPLAPIYSALEILRQVGAPDPEADEARDILERQLRHLTRLVDDLLDVNRVSHGKVGLLREPIDLVAVVREAIETTEPLIAERRHELEVVLPPGPVPLVGDAVRLGQVVTNLLTNAAKYTGPGGRIGLIVEAPGPNEASPGTAVVRVRDTGIGIPPEKLPRVFELFVQINPTLDRAQGGLGIGLSLVKRLVELHGGTVTAHSDGPGRGSEFVVRLPLPRNADGQRRPPIDGPRTNSLPHGSPMPPGKRVLVVDDNRDAARSLAIVLRRQGHDVCMAHDGPGALTAAAEFHPEVMLLDIGLPGLDGYEVARQLRQRPEGPKILLIALTGYGQAEDRECAEEAGFDRYFVKPIDPVALREVIDTPRQ